MEISISINKDKTQFGFLTNPSLPNEHHKKIYYLYHTGASAFLENRRHNYGSSHIQGKDEFMPLVERVLHKDIIARHGRNFQNKEYLYFM